MAMVEEGCMEARVVAKSWVMVHNASRSGLRPFFFFALHLEKLEVL